MNLAELKAKLVEEYVPPDAYCLTGGLPNEAFCIEQAVDGNWNTYNSERGQKTGLRHFETEEEACGHLYRAVTDLKALSEDVDRPAEPKSERRRGQN